MKNKYAYNPQSESVFQSHVRGQYLNMTLTYKRIMLMAPEHEYSSCSDSDPCNAYDGSRNIPIEDCEIKCTRCYLVKHLGQPIRNLRKKPICICM